MKSDKLEHLIKCRAITSYKYVNLKENGEIGEGDCRNTEQLILKFPTGDTLTIDTFCSGVREDTSLIIK